MAKPTSTEATKAKTKNLPMNWDEELAKQAQVAAGMEESVATGQFFGLKGGLLTWNDSPIPGNQMAVIIIDHILENVYYDGRFDPDTPQAPTCFAFGRDDKTMAPHKVVMEAGANKDSECSECELNQWGSADTGRGKACRNVRRLAMIPAGTLDGSKFKMFDDAAHFENASIGYMKLPVTSVKGYAGFVKQVAAALKRPPHGIITKVSVVSDPSTQFKVIFEPLMEVPNELMRTIMKRNEEVRAVIEFPYTLDDNTEQNGKGRGGAKKPPAKTKRKY